MNLSERAELAYEHYIDSYGIDWGSDCELFTAGYLAAAREAEKTPHVIDENHAYGDQEVYYGVFTEYNFESGAPSVIKLVACVSEDSADLSDDHGDLRDIDEFDFVVGPFRE